VLATAQLALNQVDAAGAAVKQALALDSTDPLVRGQLGMVEARVRLQENRDGEAKTEIESISKGLAKGPILSMQFEIRLVEAELLVHTGNRLKAKESIEKLKRDADKAGFKLVEKRAESLLQKGARAA
jgi:hypothetical protein